MLVQIWQCHPVNATKIISAAGTLFPISNISSNNSPKCTVFKPGGMRKAVRRIISSLNAPNCRTGA